MSDLGDMLPLPVRSDAAVERLRRRRSAPAQNLTAPGPTPDQLSVLLELAARTPDHGKLFPWRFVIIDSNAKPRLVKSLLALSASQPEPVKAEAVLSKLANPPVTVLVISRPVESLKVPLWEQELSAGAVCMNLEHAADSMGYSASWITDWYAYDRQAAALFGLTEGEKIAGFIHIGTLAEPPLERPRPDMASIVSRLD